MGSALFPRNDEVIYGGDLASQFYYWKGYLVDNIRNGVIPFWNPYLFSGTPFIAHPSIAPFYPFTALFILLPLNIAFSYFIAIHLVISGIGMYLLAQKFCNKTGSITAASCFALSGYFAARIYAGHIDLLSTAAWIPWVIYSMIVIFQNRFSRKRFIMGVFSWSMLVFAGYGAYLIFTTMFITAFALHHIVVVKIHNDNLKISIKRIFTAFGTLLIALFITSVQWLPTWELTRHSIRATGLPYDLASWGSLPLTGLKLFIDPLDAVELNKIVFNLGGGPLPNPFDHFIGAVPLLTTVIFLISQIVQVLRKRTLRLTILQRDIGFFTLLSLIFLWISFAYYSPVNLHRILYALVPFYRYIRMPIQHLVIAVVLASLLTGIAVSHIKYKTVQILILIAICTELFTFGKKYVFLTKLPTSILDQRLITYLKKELRGARVLAHFRVVSPVLTDFELNAPVKYQLFTTSGYDPVILRNYYDYIDRANGSSMSSVNKYNVEIPPINLIPSTLLALNVGYILEEKNNDSVSNEPIKYTKLLEGDRYYLYKVNQSASRFTLQSNSSECAVGEFGRVLIQKYAINEINLKVETPCDGILNSSEVYYPGWKAKIDGKPTNILLSNNLFRTINMPKEIGRARV